MTRVIVADDDPKIADYYFTELFELYGVTVDVASNGRELVQQVLDGGYDFAITDYNMPEMNGLEAVSVIRDRGINIPILMISASDVSKRAAELDVHFLEKPLGPNTFYDSVEKLLGI
jgi:CheY-like chemotaxis protein